MKRLLSVSFVVFALLFAAGVAATGATFSGTHNGNGLEDSTAASGTIYLPFTTLISVYDQPTPLYPPNGAVLNTLIPTFRWGMPYSNESRRLTACLGYSTNPNSIDCTYARLYEEETQFQVWRNLKPATLYYWRVGYYQDNNEDGMIWSDIWQFKTGSNGVRLPAPTLLSPPDGSTLTRPELTFEGSAIAGSIEYMLSICRDWCYVYFSPVPTFKLERPCTAPFDPVEYSWHIAAKNDFAWGEDSASWDFLFQSVTREQMETNSCPSTWSTATLYETGWVIRTDSNKGSGFPAR